MAIIEIDSEWRPTVLDLGQVAGAFSFEEGFSRPDWKIIRTAIGQAAASDELDAAWADAVVQWVLRIQGDLGGEYRVRCSDEFILLSALDLTVASDLLRFAEATLEKIYAALKEAAWRWEHGKHVLLLFTEDDDYYQYVSFFYQDGIHPASGGCLIHRDYVHIAMFLGDGRSIRTMLAHELTHNSVVHLRLPLWLNEGLAVLFQRTASQWPRDMLEGDLRERHLAFWNPESIQRFWSGVSFDEPGESNELSYSLAEILVRLLLDQPGEFGAFVQQAKWDDAGQTAALDCLGRDLGQVAGTFLGDGNWRPYRKSLVECWEAAKKDKAQGGDKADLK
jgi:hypothetical protein